MRGSEDIVLRVLDVELGGHDVDGELKRTSRSLRHLVLNVLDVIADALKERFVCRMIPRTQAHVMEDQCRCLLSRPISAVDSPDRRPVERERSFPPTRCPTPLHGIGSLPPTCPQSE